jgi:hypothetical protein
MTPAPVINLAEARRSRRAGRARPFARRAIVAFAIGISLLGALVLVGVAATALTPRTPLALLAAVALAVAAGWPLSAVLIARAKRSGPRAGLRESLRTVAIPRFAKRAHRAAPARTVTNARARFGPNPLHPSAREWDARQPTRRP